MATGSIEEIFNRFNDITALVIGDVMIDAYIWGKVERISPEAPVPVVGVTAKEQRLGGAANVALNLAALGAKPIVCTVSGNDLAGELLKDLFSQKGMDSTGIIAVSSRPTSVKTRIISNHQHIVRIDEESVAPLQADEEIRFIKSVEALINSSCPDVLVFEDYNKGLLTPNIIATILSMAKEKGIPTAVDPKKDHFFAYEDVTLFKPNLKELSEGLKIDIPKQDADALEKAVSALGEKIRNTIALITLSEEGIYVRKNGQSHRIPAHLRKIADVSGAGDTVISVAALCLAIGTDEVFMAQLANLAGGLVCEKVGVVPIEKNMLLQEAKRKLSFLYDQIQRPIR